MILIKKILNLLKIKNKKTSQLLNTENNFRFSKGDRVKVKFLLEFDDINLEYDYIGFIVDINERYVVPSIENSYKIEYKVKGSDNVSSGWYEPKDILPYSLEDEREEKLNKILK